MILFTTAAAKTTFTFSLSFLLLLPCGTLPLDFLLQSFIRLLWAFLHHCYYLYCSSSLCICKPCHTFFFLSLFFITVLSFITLLYYHIFFCPSVSYFMILLLPLLFPLAIVMFFALSHPEDIFFFKLLWFVLYFHYSSFCSSCLFLFTYFFAGYLLIFFPLFHLIHIFVVPLWFFVSLYLFFTGYPFFFLSSFPSIYFIILLFVSPPCFLIIFHILPCAFIYQLSFSLPLQIFYLTVCFLVGEIYWHLSWIIKQEEGRRVSTKVLWTWKYMKMNNAYTPGE